MTANKRSLVRIMMIMDILIALTSTMREAPATTQANNFSAHSIKGIPVPIQHLGGEWQMYIQTTVLPKDT